MVGHDAPRQHHHSVSIPDVSNHLDEFQRFLVFIEDPFPPGYSIVDVVDPAFDKHP